MNIDCMAWHQNPVLELGLEDAQAGTHIGFYIGWLAEKDLLAAHHMQAHVEALRRFKNRQVTGRDLLIEVLHEGFSEDDLNAEAALFTEQYYDSSGLYFKDYLEVFGIEVDQFYTVAHSWEHFDRIAAKLERRFQTWQLQRSKELSHESTGLWCHAAAVDVAQRTADPQPV